MPKDSYNGYRFFVEKIFLPLMPWLIASLFAFLTYLQVQVQDLRIDVTKNKTTSDNVVERLDRIETKLDRIIEGGG